MPQVSAVQVRCRHCAWAATGVSDDAERTLKWLEQELSGHLQQAHGQAAPEARRGAEQMVSATRTGNAVTPLAS